MSLAAVSTKQIPPNKGGVMATLMILAPLVLLTICLLAKFD